MQQPRFKKMPTPWGNLDITRMPADCDPSLQGWDGADKYILETLAERGHTAQTPANPLACLLLNDHHGALTTALANFQSTVIVDSFRGRQSLLQNIKRNPRSLEPTISNLEDLPHHSIFDLVLIKIPKSHDLLDWQLSHIRPHITSETLIIAGGLTRTIHKKTIQIFEQHLGATPTTRARYKSRLLLPSFEGTLPEARAAASPRVWTYGDISIVNYPGVFSGERLDIGSRFLLERLEDETKSGTILDLGCGNGVLSAFYAYGKEAQVIAVDDSWQAVLSAKGTFKQNEISAQVIHQDDLSSLEDSSVDVVLCNPPFHEGHGLSYSIAEKMFDNAKRVLKQDGIMWVVGNRHLGYHALLRKTFRRVNQEGSHPKFVALKCFNDG